MEVPDYAHPYSYGDWIRRVVLTERKLCSVATIVLGKDFSRFILYYDTAKILESRRVCYRFAG
jgi:hypothetical protein